MQRFLLFCTMLIFTCEAFRPQFHGSQTLSAKRKSLNPSYPYSDNELYLPVNLIMSRDSKPYHEPRLPPLNRNKCLHNDFSTKSCYFRRRKKPHSYPRITSNSLQYIRPRKPKFRPHRLFPNHKFFKRRDLSNYPEIIIRKRNQYYVCPYSLFKSDYPERLFRRRNIRLPDIKRQCVRLKSVRLKNKRSAKKAIKKREHDQRNDQISALVVDFKPVNVTLKNDVNESESLEPKHSVSSPVTCPCGHVLNQTSIPVSNNPENSYVALKQNSSLSDKNLKSNLREKEDVSLTMKKTDDKLSSDVSEDIIKLKQKLQEVENVLKEENPDLLEGESLSELLGRRSSKKDETAPKMSDDDIKAKIDKVAIPMLTQISEKLSQCKEEKKSSKSKDKHDEITKEKDKETSKEFSSGTKVKPGHQSNSEPQKLESCVPEGTWYSGALELQLNITILSSLMLNVKIRSCKPDNVVNKKWIMQGLALSKHGGPLILAGIYPEKRKIASFVGQCRIAKGEEFIFGSWTITSCAQKIAGLWTSMETKNDVLSRTPTKKSTGGSKEKKGEEKEEEKEDEEKSDKSKHHDKHHKHHHEEHEKHEKTKTEEKEEHEKKDHEKKDEEKTESDEKDEHEKHKKKEHHKLKEEHEKKSHKEKEHESKEENQEKSID